jgi:hypothetical protein
MTSTVFGVILEKTAVVVGVLDGEFCLLSIELGVCLCMRVYQLYRYLFDFLPNWKIVFT